jgi:DNA-binding MarR family transcriptional regulator
MGGLMNTTGDMSMADYRALAELRYQIRRYLRFSEQAAREVGLVPQQHQLLLALKGLPAGRKATISELAERLQIRHHSTVELIDRLVERGLVKRLRDEADQRRVIIHLTPQGEQVLRRLSLLHRHELQLAGPAFVRALGALIAVDTDTAEVAQGRTDVPQKHVED